VESQPSRPSCFARPNASWSNFESFSYPAAILGSSRACRADGRPFAYWTYSEIGDDLGAAVLNTLQRPWLPFEVMFSPREKVETMLYLLVPFLGLALCSRVALIAVPLLAERFLSTNTAFWGTSFHYSMAIAPVLAMAAAAGLANVARLGGLRFERRIATAGAAAMLAAGLAITMFAIPSVEVPLRQVVAPALYDAPPYADAVNRALDHVPRDASVAAPDFLTPHLAARDRVYEIGPETPPSEFLITGLIRRVGSNSTDGRATYREYHQRVADRLLAYQPTFYEDGWIVLRRRPAGTDSGTNGVLQPLPRDSAERLVPLNQTWQRTVDQTVGQLLRCTGLQQVRDSTARACFSSAGLALSKAHASLDRELSAALPRLTDGCLQLGTLARAGARRTAADFQMLRDTGAAGAAIAYRRAAEAAVADINDRDLPGRTNRFLLLCYPRPLRSG